MSKAAGTMDSTYNLTFLKPGFIPGYKGYIPSIKYDYGQSYGSQTANYLRKFRHENLESSKSNLNQGGIFCTLNTNNGADFCQARARKYESYIPEPNYRLTNQDTAAVKRHADFVTKRMHHREQYKDTTGTLAKQEYFYCPKNFETREAFMNISKNMACDHFGVPW